MPNLTEKKCSHCSRIKPVSEFRLRKGSTTGYRGECRECSTAIAKDRYQRERGRILEQKRVYHAENREALLARHKEWEKANPEYGALYREKNKEYFTKYRAENKEVLNKRSRAHKKACAMGSLAHKYVGRLVDVDRAEVVDDILQCSCTYCGQSFVPSVAQVQQRVESINQIKKGDRRLYCSRECKEACPIYGMYHFPKGFFKLDVLGTSREVQSQLRQMVLERDSYTCQKCGAGIEAGLHCHHIDPVVNNPIESADVDNCITLCKDCHKEVHQIPGCGTKELRCA